MRLTSKGRYAVRAMLDLTFHSKGNPVRLQEISTRQAISLHYLEQLFRKLRTGSVVKSVRGPGGGYVLARSMDEITIKDVLECVGENINPAKDILGNPSSGVERTSIEGTEAAPTKVDTVEFNLTRGFFQNLGILMQEYLSTTSLGDLMRKSREAGLGSQNSTDSTIAARNEAGQATSANESIIRPNLGEINQ